MNTYFSAENKLTKICIFHCEVICGEELRHACTLADTTQ